MGGAPVARERRVGALGHHPRFYYKCGHDHRFGYGTGDAPNDCAFEAGELLAWGRGCHGSRCRGGRRGVGSLESPWSVFCGPDEHGSQCFGSAI